VRIAGSLVVVTGASGGLGAEIARSLDAHGARLILTGRNTDALRALSSGLRQAQTITCDLAQRGGVEDLIGGIVEADIVVANAALPAAGALIDFTDVELDRALDVNLRAPILIAKRIVPAMVGRGRGHLVFVSSMGGKVPASRLSVYSATKYGLRGFAACLRRELDGSGVGVSAIFPGSVRDVGMWADSGATGRVGTVSSSAVTEAVIRAIENDRAEVDVAPLTVRVGAALAHVAPEMFGRLYKRSRADEQTESLAAGLRHKR